MDEIRVAAFLNGYASTYRRLRLTEIQSIREPVFQVERMGARHRHGIWIENEVEKERKMAKTDSTFLDTGNDYPKMDLQLLNGTTLRLPNDFGNGYGVVLFYRGHW